MRKLNALKLTTIEGIAFSNKNTHPENCQLDKKYKLQIFNTAETSNIKRIDQKKKADNTCYAVFDNDKIIHESWIFYHKLITTQLSFKNALTIGDCYTHNEYKGQGIYTCILKKILFDFKDQALVIYTTPDNIISVKGILKAGFIKSFSFKLTRFLGLRIKLNKYEFITDPKRKI
jgi:hypothetical protein